MAKAKSKYEDHKYVLKALAASQEADIDNRRSAREAHEFVDKEDGQWEPTWWEANKNSPRYTFDMTGPIVDQVAGGMELQDFDIRITPSGGEASKDVAKLMDGMIRNIEKVSSASKVYSMAGRNMVTAGLDGWQLKQEYVDDDSFDQELVIRRIANFLDSVWFGPFTEPDASDAPWVIVLEAMDKEEYKDTYPDRVGTSLDDGREGESYYHKNDVVIIGNLYYFEERASELALMKSGRVLDKKEVDSVLDELGSMGDTVEETRSRQKRIVKSRLLDGEGWINDPEDTVFSWLPVIPTFGNFKVVENKVLYRGVVQKLMDPQRVFNYSKSREVEENALAPRGKYWMTKEQAKGHTAQLATLNTNSDPVQFYNVDPRIPGPPQQSQGAQVNPGLAVLSGDMQGVMERTAGRFAAGLGNNPNAQSGVAIQKLQDRGNIGDVKYVSALEVAICHTAKILVNAIPVVYSEERKTRILQEDGGFDIATVNQVVMDEETQAPVVINDLARGKYDVSCSAGPSFQSRQQETVSALTEISQIDPSSIEMGSDILFNNMSSPGMDLLAARKRKQLFMSGVIPDEQLTDEEKALIQAMQQQPKEPDPQEILAQAEIGKAQAEMNKAQAQADAVMVNASAIQRKEDRADAVAQEKMDLDQEKFDFETTMKMLQQQADAQAAIIAEQQALANTLRAIKEAMGAQGVLSPEVVEAFANTAEQLNDLTKE